MIQPTCPPGSTWHTTGGCWEPDPNNPTSFQRDAAGTPIRYVSPICPSGTTYDAAGTDGCITESERKTRAVLFIAKTAAVCGGITWAGAKLFRSENAGKWAVGGAIVGPIALYALAVGFWGGWK